MQVQKKWEIPYAVLAHWTELGTAWRMFWVWVKVNGLGCIMLF